MSAEEGTMSSCVDNISTTQKAGHSENVLGGPNIVTLAEYRSTTHTISIRILDLFISLLALVLLSPLMLAIAVLIKMDSRGPVLFRHLRIGINRRRRLNREHWLTERRKQDLFGKRFTLYKFRSMYADAKERFPELYAYSYSEEELRTLPIKILVSTKGKPREFNSTVQIEEQNADDPRVTRIGRWLRKTSLDELPNFLNVMKGDMHLVGPRPDIAENIRYYPESHLLKLRVKPGITGLAQISGRGRLSFEQTNAYDIEYVINRSLLLDLKILLKTILVSLKRDGAF